MKWTVTFGLELTPQNYIAYDMNKEHINELINSGITLTDKETEIVEEHLYQKSQRLTPYQANSCKGLSAIRAGVKMRLSQPYPQLQE